MTYNILAKAYADEKYFPKCPHECLAWDFRKDRLVSMIRELDADIMALQELERDDHEEIFQKAFDDYESVYKKRTFIKPDGCGIYFRKNKFRLVHQVDIELNELAELPAIQTRRAKIDDYNTNNVGIIALLEVLDPVIDKNDLRNENDKEKNKGGIIREHDKEKNEGEHSSSSGGSRFLWVANVHLFWNPQYPEVKLLQSHKMTEEISAAQLTFQRGAYANYPIIFAGDYNSLPNSAVYRFLSNGNISWKEQAKLGLDLFPSLTHELPLASVCAGINEPLTNITSKFTGCLDYIWYDYTRLRLTSLLGKLEASKYSTDVALPNSMQPSDHIPLFASFTISPQ